MPTVKKKSLAQIQAQIERLQKEADALRAAEVAGVVERIREAIDHYGLTAEDLGLTGAPAPRRRAAPAEKKPARAAEKPTVGVAKYGDGQGRTWTGRGKRPQWYVQALAAGKSADDLLLSKG